MDGSNYAYTASQAIIQAACRQARPPIFTVAEFHGHIQDFNPDILLHARVSHGAQYHPRGGQDYVVLTVTSGGTSDLGSSISLSLRWESNLKGTIQISSDISKLYGLKDEMVSFTSYFDLRLFHVLDLLARIDLAGDIHPHIGENLWVYSTIIMGTLTPFGTWGKEPTSADAGRNSKFFTKTMNATSLVMRGFLGQWVIGPIPNSLVLENPKVWARSTVHYEISPHPLNQTYDTPPESDNTPQSPVGADNTLGRRGTMVTALIFRGSQSPPRSYQPSSRPSGSIHQPDSSLGLGLRLGLSDSPVDTTNRSDFAPSVHRSDSNVSLIPAGNESPHTRNNTSTEHGLLSLSHLPISESGMRLFPSPPPSLHHPETPLGTDPKGDTLIRIIWEAIFLPDEETRQKSIAVLLMVYPSFVSGVDLLQGLKVLFDQAHPSFEKFRETRPRILHLIRKWEPNYDDETSLRGCIQTFMISVQTIVQLEGNLDAAAIMNHISKSAQPPQPNLEVQSCPREPPPSNVTQNKSVWGSFSRLFTSRNDPKGIVITSTIAVVSKKADIPKLALALDNMEIYVRRRLKVPFLAMWLQKRRDGEFVAPISDLSHKIRVWVIDSVLDKDIGRRADALVRISILAQQCVSMGNLAMADDLRSALDDELLKPLKYTQELARRLSWGKSWEFKSPVQLSEMIADAETAGTARFLPWITTVEGLSKLFDDTVVTREPELRIFWPACNALDEALRRVIDIPAPSSTAAIFPPVDDSYAAFLSHNFDAALRHQLNHVRWAEQRAESDRRDIIPWRGGMTGSTAFANMGR